MGPCSPLVLESKINCVDRLNTKSEHTVALQRRELSTHAEQSTRVKLHAGKAEGNIMMLLCPSLGPDQRKCSLLVSIWKCVCEERREETIL